MTRRIDVQFLRRSVGCRRRFRSDGSQGFCSLTVRQNLGVYPSERNFRLMGRSREFGRLRRPKGIDEEPERTAHMPFILEAKDVLPEVAEFKSVLIVPCRFCPAASTAVKSDEAYIEFPRRALKTASYERQIAEMKEAFTQRGITTVVFRSHLLHQFVLCMWTARRRRALLERARDFDAVVVMGCEAAVATARSTLESSACHVISALRSEGIMSIQPKFSLPCTVRLELESITPYIYPEGENVAARQA